MRGLKQQRVIVRRIHSTSHLLQMRGLKPLLQPKRFARRDVASFTDAWIETKRFADRNQNNGRIFYRCVD